MKRYLLLIITFTLFLSSCDKLGGNFNAKIEKATNEAIAKINNEKQTAIENADEEITKIITKATEGANQDLSKTINSAKDEIRSSVIQGVNESIDQTVDILKKNIANNKRLTFIVGILSIISIVLIIIDFLIIYKRKSYSSTDDFKDEVVMIVTKSTRVDQSIKEVIWQELKKRPDSLRQPSHSELENAIINCLQTSPRINEYLKSRICLSTDSKINASGEDANPTVDVPKEENIVELFARDSRSKTLSGVQTSYQQGKSLYRLLVKENCTSADLTLCLDPMAKKRILNNSEDYLMPVCKVERKSSHPSDVKVINMGLATKISGDSWEVNTPIEVEFS